MRPSDKKQFYKEFKETFKGLDDNMSEKNNDVITGMLMFVLSIWGSVSITKLFVDNVYAVTGIVILFWLIVMMWVTR